MYSTIARNLVYPAADRLLGTKVMTYLKELEESQWWSPEQLRELQDRKLRALVQYAYDKVPYYRRIFQERGLTAESIQTVKDLQMLPILTKDIIRDQISDLIAEDANGRKAFLNSTGGTTGQPLKYWIDMDVTSISWAGMFRGWGWARYRLGDKRSTLAGSSLVPDEKPPLPKRLRWILERDKPFSAVHMNKERMAAYVKHMTSYNPVFLRGYATSLYTFAIYLQETGVNTIRPRAIFSTAEMLLPRYREIIESQFGCRVYDQYGCYDGGLQAMECCSHSGYHISVEKVIMEFVGEDQNAVVAGCPGAILATDLHNYSMPFIRYAVGDRGTLSNEACACGRGLPLMRSLEGRTTDILRFSNGTTLSGPALTVIFGDCPVKQYQVIQTTGDNLLVKVIRDTNYTEEATIRFMRIIKAHVGEEVTVQTEFVSHIPTTKGGKHRFIVSLLSDS